jgi:hypothetical protein
MHWRRDNQIRRYALSVAHVVVVVVTSMFISACANVARDGRRLPQTSAENRAASVAVRFAAAVRGGRLEVSCGLIGDPKLSREFRCNLVPRIPARIRFDSNDAFEVIDVYRVYGPGKSRRPESIGIALVPGHPAFAVHVNARGRIVWAGSSGYG